jgi:probable HAF family extracellular repeat protein
LIPANTLFPRLARYLIVVAATLALPVMSAFPIRAAAQEHHHYKLIDTGTFGGPMSFLNLSANGVPALNIQGTTVGDSNTATLQTSISDGFVCAGTFSGVPYVFHAFALRNGVVSDLGALPPADENCSNAGSVNANGEISGTSEVDEIDPVLGTKKFRAVLWKEGEIVNLGTFGGAYSVGGVVAGAINNHSQVVGAALNAIPDPFSLLYQLAGSPNGTQTRAFLWQNGHMLDLQTLGGPDAWAYFVNERGQIAGESYTNSTPNPVTGVPNLDPFLWQHGTMLDLGTLGGAFGQPVGLNNRGQVIGYSSLAADPGACLTGGSGAPNCDVFLWDQDKLIDLTTNTIGGSPSYVFGINDATEIVGAAAFPNAQFDAFLWRKGVATDLGHLEDCGSLAFSINSHSQVVGGTFACAGGHSRAFLWEHGSMVDLNTLVPPGSPLQLVEAVTINERGEIAGNGVPLGLPPTDFFTLGHAFLLIPCDEGHPSIEGCDYGPVEVSAVAASHTTSHREMTPEDISRIHALLMKQHHGFMQRAMH